MVYGTAVLALFAAAFVGFVIVSQKNAPGAAFWSFAILVAIPPVLLLLVPVITERFQHLTELTVGGTAFKFADEAIQAEKRAQAAESQLQQLKAAGTTIPPPKTTTGWQLQTAGDCPGRDFASTEGNEPKIEYCKDSNVSAVCWDGGVFANPTQFGGRPWCTYKNVPPSECVGGRAPGRLFRCVPKS
jgi:hypothetical protein